MGLITLIIVVVTILAILGLGWNVYISGVYKGRALTFFFLLFPSGLW
jgi:hypothetical protein